MRTVIVVAIVAAAQGGGPRAGDIFHGEADLLAGGDLESRRTGGTGTIVGPEQIHRRSSRHAATGRHDVPIDLVGVAGVAHETGRIEGRGDDWIIRRSRGGDGHRGLPQRHQRGRDRRGGGNGHGEGSDSAARAGGARRHGEGDAAVGRQCRGGGVHVIGGGGRAERLAGGAGANIGSGAG